LQPHSPAWIVPQKLHSLQGAACKRAGAESDQEGGRRPESTLAFCLQSSGAAAAAEERRRLADDNAALREAAVAAEGRELAAAGEAAELRRRLADALRCAEAEPVPTADAAVQARSLARRPPGTYQQC